MVGKRILNLDLDGEEMVAGIWRGSRHSLPSLQYAGNLPNVKMTHLKVAVRVRPLSNKEIEDKTATKILEVEKDGRTVSITNVKVPEQNAGDSRERIRRFTFDFCFKENSTQDDVFRAIEGVVRPALKRRHHSCVLAYGQSSSGKTHTMMGFPHDPGLTPILCQRVFDYLQETATESEMRTGQNASVSYLEIYNEKVRDLLGNSQHCEKSDKQGSSGILKVRQHPKKGPYVQGLTEHQVSDSSSLLRLLQTGNISRRVAATPSNPQSSRSHSVLLITFSGGVRLTLVDLAGSERTGNRCCYNTSRFREGTNINKSLVALGNVISALAEDTSRSAKGTRRRFIPYRDSILTWLLKDTLGGNSDTVMIATISPSSTCYSETLNTLRFGQRAKLIVSLPVVNEGPWEKTIRELRAEIVRLKDLLNVKGIPLIESNIMASAKKHKSNTDLREIDSHPPQNTVLEKLIPVMNISSSVNKNERVTPKLRRTFSVVGQSTKDIDYNPKRSGSQEIITKRPITSRKSSLKVSKKPTDVKKIEKSTETVGKPSPNFHNIESRVDSLRRTTPPKPRSQIVAAVTSRLYAKTKKKEIGVDTSDIESVTNSQPPRELSICSNARFRLRELTRKALKAHRSRNEYTQTDLFPVLRVKETSTDVGDLKLLLNETRDVETTTENDTEDKEIDCVFLSGLSKDELCQYLQNAFLVTNSCGTQSDPTTEAEPLKSQSSVSFTKYLKDLTRPQIEMFNPHTANPIYTSSVNINISHNYINGNLQKPSNDSAMSGDSLDEDECNLNLPTPDLISNHNSLEPHAASVCEKGTVKHAELSTICQIERFVEEKIFRSDYVMLQTEPLLIPQHQDEVESIHIPTVCVPQVCIVDYFDSCELFFPNTEDQPIKAILIEYKYHIDDCIKIMKPVVLKSIMKHMPDGKFESEDSASEVNLPDSLEYHIANSCKKVHFSKSGDTSRSNRLMKVMSEFLEEAAILMNNLSAAAKNISPNEYKEYEVQVTVNDIDLVQGPAELTYDKQSTCCQTDGCLLVDTDLPVNKYEVLVEESCRRLEAKLNRMGATSNLDQTYGFSDESYNFSFNHEDISLESNALTFSDYGSLPRRRKHKRRRTSSRSPSAFLRQLSSMRRRIIEASRDKFNSNDHTQNVDS